MTGKSAYLLISEEYILTKIPLGNTWKEITANMRYAWHTEEMDIGIPLLLRQEKPFPIN